MVSRSNSADDQHQAGVLEKPMNVLTSGGSPTVTPAPE